MSMKRSREAEEITTMANSLLLLSTMSSTPSSSSSSFEYSNTNTNRMFTCKTCNKKFPSFQALGGHRASHKKPRFSNDDQVTIQQPPKPKVHECSICGLEFSIGQALGGHMRRHRQVASSLVDGDGKILSLSPPNYYHHKDSVAKKKANGANRVLCLDLNLTPSENQFVFGHQIASLIC